MYLYSNHGQQPASYLVDSVSRTKGMVLHVVPVLLHVICFCKTGPERESADLRQEHLMKWTTNLRCFSCCSSL